MKYILAFLSSWLCYYLGRFYSVILELWDNDYWVAFWYPVYSDCMITSVEIQDQVNGKSPRFPWAPLESGEPNEEAK